MAGDLPDYYFRVKENGAIAFWIDSENRQRRDDGWMILKRGALELEFFPHPDLVPGESWFSACIRVDDPDALHAEWKALGLPGDHRAIPRQTGFFQPGEAPRMFALVDADGSLLRCMGNGG